MKLHFEGFKACLKKWGITDNDVYNFDAIGFQIGVTSGGRVVVPADCDKVFSNDLDNRELITSVECFSATGYHVPSMLISKGAYHLRKYFEQDEDEANALEGNALFARSESGFTTDKLSISFIRHFENFTASRTKGVYRMLIFDGHGSHITKDFLEFAGLIRFDLFNFLRTRHILHNLQMSALSRNTSITSNKSFESTTFSEETRCQRLTSSRYFNPSQTRHGTTKLCAAAFRKTVLIPFNPEVVFSEMKRYSGIQDTFNTSRDQDKEPSSSPAFVTPPPRPWSEFKTPVAFTQRKRGLDYVNSRLENGPLTPCVRRVKQKVDEFTEKNNLQGHLAEHLINVLSHQISQAKRDGAKGTVIQKYGEIYVSTGRKQIEWLDNEEENGKNLIEERKKKQKKL